MKKNKKNKIFCSWIAAKHVFAPEVAREGHYKWQGWGLVIREIREHAGMDQTVFGRLLRGYTRAQISRYEKEAAEPPIDFWVKMAKFFGLNISWALTGEGESYIEDFQDTEERERFIEWIVLITEQEDFVKKLRD